MARAAVKKGLCEADVPSHMEALLRAYHLPVDCPFTADQLVRVALSDKKRKGNSITLVLPERVGKSRLYRISTDELLDFFAAGL
jgi:3-dehydroquinate synthase